MIQDFELCINTHFVFGHHAHARVGTELRHRNVTKVLLHYDGGTYLDSILCCVKESLSHAGIAFVELSGVQPNPKLSLVRQGIALVHREHVDAVVAIGGGSVIDSAKAIAIGAIAQCDVWDLFTGKEEPHMSLPVAVVLTLPASGSESSKVAVITHEEERRKLLLSHPLLRPTLAFMNPELTLSVPKYPTACGIVDMFSHICERYFTADTDWNVGDYLCEGLLRCLVKIGPQCVQALDNYDLRAQIMWIATVAQNNMLSIGRQEDWSTHLIANEISALYDIAHGATLSIVMPSWMRVASVRNPKRFIRYTKEVFGFVEYACLPQAQQEEDLIRRGISATVDFFHSLDMPTSFVSAGLPCDRIEQMLDQIAFFGEDQAIGSVARLNRDDCRVILRNALGNLNSQNGECC